MPETSANPVLAAQLTVQLLQLFIAFISPLEVRAEAGARQADTTNRDYEEMDNALHAH